MDAEQQARLMLSARMAFRRGIIAGVLGLVVAVLTFAVLSKASDLWIIVSLIAFLLDGVIWGLTLAVVLINWVLRTHLLLEED